MVSKRSSSSILNLPGRDYSLNTCPELDNSEDCLVDVDCLDVYNIRPPRKTVGLVVIVECIQDLDYRQKVSYVGLSSPKIHERRNARVDMSGKPPGAGLIPELGIGDDIFSVDFDLLT
jgi:hypothetical protein